MSAILYSGYGPVGPTGPRGKRGKNGKNGRIGPQGPQGPPGSGNANAVLRPDTIIGNPTNTIPVFSQANGGKLAQTSLNVTNSNELSGLGALRLNSIGNTRQGFTIPANTQLLPYSINEPDLSDVHNDGTYIYTIASQQLSGAITSLNISIYDKNTLQPANLIANSVSSAQFNPVLINPNNNRRLNRVRYCKIRTSPLFPNSLLIFGVSQEPIPSSVIVLRLNLNTGILSLETIVNDINFNNSFAGFSQFSIVDVVTDSLNNFYIGGYASNNSNGTFQNGFISKLSQSLSIDATFGSNGTVIVDENLSTNIFSSIVYKPDTNEIIALNNTFKGSEGGPTGLQVNTISIYSFDAITGALNFTPPAPLLNDNGDQFLSVSDGFGIPTTSFAVDSNNDIYVLFPRRIETFPINTSLGGRSLAIMKLLRDPVNGYSFDSVYDLQEYTTFLINGNLSPGYNIIITETKTLGDVVYFAFGMLNNRGANIPIISQLLSFNTSSKQFITIKQYEINGANLSALYTDVSSSRIGLLYGDNTNNIIDSFNSTDLPPSLISSLNLGLINNINIPTISLGISTNKFIDTFGNQYIGTALQNVGLYDLKLNTIGQFDKHYSPYVYINNNNTLSSSSTNNRYQTTLNLLDGQDRQVKIVQYNLNSAQRIQIIRNLTNGQRDYSVVTELELSFVAGFNTGITGQMLACFDNLQRLYVLYTINNSKLYLMRFIGDTLFYDASFGPLGQGYININAPAPNLRLTFFNMISSGNDNNLLLSGAESDVSVLPITEVGVIYKVDLATSALSTSFGQTVQGIFKIDTTNPDFNGDSQINGITIINNNIIICGQIRSAGFIATVDLNGTVMTNYVIDNLASTYLCLCRDKSQNIYVVLPPSGTVNNLSMVKYSLQGNLLNIDTTFNNSNTYLPITNGLSPIGTPSISLTAISFNNITNKVMLVGRCSYTSNLYNILPDKMFSLTPIVISISTEGLLDNKYGTIVTGNNILNGQVRFAGNQLFFRDFNDQLMSIDMSPSLS